MDKRFSQTANEFTKAELSIQTIITYQEEFSHNRLLYLIHCLVLTLTHYCRTIASVIMLSKNYANELIMKEYILRYSAYIDLAMHMNSQLENINVLVNSCSDNLFKTHIATPKFSILRVMVSIIFICLVNYME